MSRFLALIVALCITISGTGCDYGKSASDPPQVSERPLVSDDSGQTATTPGLKNESTINQEEAQDVKLKITIGEKHATAVLDDCSTARDFMSLLPITLMMTYYNGTEKVADLPRQLNLDGAPAGFKPTVGDIGTYTPWGNVRKFHLFKSHQIVFRNGLTKLLE